jgi:ankyrin repeat protein
VIVHLLNRGVSINNPLPWRTFDLDQDISLKSSLDFAQMVEMGCFVIHIAIAHNDTAMAKLLLDAGADPDLCVYYFQKEKYVNCKWKSPLVHAASQGSIEIARELARTSLRYSHL